MWGSSFQWRRRPRAIGPVPPSQPADSPPRLPPYAGPPDSFSPSVTIGLLARMQKLVSRFTLPKT